MQFELYSNFLGEQQPFWKKYPWYLFSSGTTQLEICCMCYGRDRPKFNMTLFK